MKQNILIGAAILGITAVVAIMFMSLVVIPQQKIESEERQHQAELREARMAELQTAAEKAEAVVVKHPTISSDKKEV